MVRQVDYCEQLNCLVSAAECREIPVGEKPTPGLVLTDLGVQRKETIMRMLRVSGSIRSLHKKNCFKKTNHTNRVSLALLMIRYPKFLRQVVPIVF